MMRTDRGVDEHTCEAIIRSSLRFFHATKEEKKYVISLLPCTYCLRVFDRIFLFLYRIRVRSSPLRIRVLEPQCVFHRQPT